MSQVTTRHDENNRTVVIESTFDHGIEAVWTLWSDPSKVERWWGPPGIPLTVDHHDLVPGGSVGVTARIPGQQPIRASWQIAKVKPPSALVFTLIGDGVEPADLTVAISSTDAGRTRMTIVVRFHSDSGYAQARSVGLTDGIARAVASAHEVLHRSDLGP